MWVLHVSLGRKAPALIVTYSVLLSLLDRSRTRVGFSESEALHHSVERAVQAEQLGFHRFWTAEHHAVPGVASGSPAVLLAAIGATTESIRIGSGGVMLPHHQPLIVAEQFLMLSGLYPGRVDLGLGRSLGFTEPVRRALRQDSATAEQYSADLTELRDYLEGTAAVTAQPRLSPAHRPGIYLLATGQGVSLAAQLGLPAVIGGPVLHSSELPEILVQYRRDFQPHSESHDRPEVILSADVYLGGSEQQAREAALSEAWAMARSRETGAFTALEPVEDILAATWSPRVRERVEKSLATSIIGTHTEVSAQVEQLVQSTGADEFMISTCTYDREQLAAMDAEIADLFGAG